MRVCQCGGTIRQHELTRNREAWTCGACGRYQAIAREPVADDLWVGRDSTIDLSNVATVGLPETEAA